MKMHLVVGFWVRMDGWMDGWKIFVYLRRLWMSDGTMSDGFWEWWFNCRIQTATRLGRPNYRSHVLLRTKSDDVMAHYVTNIRYNLCTKAITFLPDHTMT